MGDLNISSYLPGLIMLQIPYGKLVYKVHLNEGLSRTIRGHFEEELIGIFRLEA